MPEIGLFGSEGGAPTTGVPTLSDAFDFVLSLWSAKELLAGMTRKFLAYAWEYKKK